MSADEGEVSLPSVLPPTISTVRYVKNGRGGKWWPMAKDEGRIYGGWKEVPPELLCCEKFDEIEKLLRGEYRKSRMPEGTATNDINQLRGLICNPSQHLWITFENGDLWWCTVIDDIGAREGEDDYRGHFWLTCDRQWTNKSLTGNRLAVIDLPGPVGVVAGFRATVCAPSEQKPILHAIRGEVSEGKAILSATKLRYEKEIEIAIGDIGWKDFELIIDLICNRCGLTRVSRLGATEEGFDVVAINSALDGRVFIQVKSKADQQTLKEYIEKFKERRSGLRDRMIFAVHKPCGILEEPDDMPELQVWTSKKIAALIVELGLGGWLLKKLP